MWVGALLVIVMTGSTTPGAVEGRVLSDATGSPIRGARVEPDPSWGDLNPVATDENGRFAFEPKPVPSLVLPQRRELHRDVMEISADGHAAITVDRYARPPWAGEIPMRAIRTLRGRMHGAVAGDAVYLDLSPQDFVWPPQTGLAVSMKEIGVTLDPEGRFQLDAVPAQTIFRLRLGRRGEYRDLDQAFALALDSADIIDFQAPAAFVKAERGEGAEQAWQAVVVEPVDARGESRSSAWFDVLPESRHIVHRFAGGRWHAHGNQPCNCIESRNGSRVLVARDRDGWIGVQATEISDQSIGKKHRVVLAPGGLLRLHLVKSAPTCRVSLRSDGSVFAVRDAVGDSVWYELAPRGTVEILIGSAGSERLVRTLTVEAGQVARVEIKGT